MICLAAWGGLLAGHPFGSRYREVAGAQLGQTPRAGRLSHIAGRTQSRQRDSAGQLPAFVPARTTPAAPPGSLLSWAALLLVALWLSPGERQMWSLPARGLFLAA